MARVLHRASDFLGADRHHPIMATHRAQGQRVVYVDPEGLHRRRRGRHERTHCPARHSRHAQRRDRLSGGQRHGLGRRRLGRRPALGDDSPGPGRLSQRQCQRAWRFQRHGLPGGPPSLPTTATTPMPFAPWCRRCEAMPGQASAAWSSAAPATGATRTSSSRPASWARPLTR